MSTLEQWAAAVAEEFGLPPEWAGVAARDIVLDLARDVAHGVARPAAPLTAFLLGAAAGASGARSAEDLGNLAGRVRSRLPTPPEET
jgi:hypothetical protein